MIPPVSFGDWLRRRRRALDMTQDELAVRVGCSLSAIRKIEQNERRPSPEIAELLANQLQVPAVDRTLFVRVARGERNVERLGLATLQPQTPAWPGPLRAVLAPRPPVSLPAQATPFLGRELEIEQLVHLLRTPGCRMVTIFGPGGSGKTRLSIEVAQCVSGDFSDGVVFVPLAPLTAAALVPEAIAGAIGLECKGCDTIANQVIDHLRERELLLVLANFEHLMDAAPWLAALLQSTAVTVLTSSRERLGVLGEWVFEIHGLAQPPEQDGGDLEKYSAAALLIAGFRRAQPDYVVHADDYQAIVRICRRLEGMPLGLELAAPWIRTLTAEEIAAEIERSYDFLATAARNVPERHRSLRAAFEHSWRLLGPHEQRMLSRLSVFRGGFGREAAAVVAGAALPDLAALMDKSLLRRAGSARYDVHELVRQFAITHLGDDDTDAHLAHARFYHDLVERANRELQGADQQLWYARLAEEQDNLRAAMDWALAQHETAVAPMLGARLWRFWHDHGRIIEGRQWLTTS